jgi:hypothetical protein
MTDFAPAVVFRLALVVPFRREARSVGHLLVARAGELSIVIDVAHDAFLVLLDQPLLDDLYVVHLVLSPSGRR